VWEWYGNEKGNKGLRMDGRTVGAKVVMERQRVSPGPCDPSAWRADMGPSAAEKMAKAGLIFFKGDNQREAGWQEMYGRIADNMLLVFDTCYDFIRTIPALEADPHNPNDVLKGGEDHVGDETRYACMSRPYKRRKPVVQPLYYKKVPKLRYCDLVDVEIPTKRWI
jgi:hypothetical protein